MGHKIIFQKYNFQKEVELNLVGKQHMITQYGLQCRMYLNNEEQDSHLALLHCKEWWEEGL